MIILKLCITDPTKAGTSDASIELIHGKHSLPSGFCALRKQREEKKYQYFHLSESNARH